MRVTSNPAGCPTCTAFIGEPCTTRTGNLAARPHQARLDAQIPLGRHTHDCRANAATAAAENIAEWDDATQAEQGTNPVYWADQNLDDQTSECICWPARRHPLINQRIRKGWMVLAEHEPTTTYTTVRVDTEGTPLTGEPERQYASASPAIAAGHAARAGMNATEYRYADVRRDGDVWTFTPSTGSPVRIRVTEPAPAAPVVEYVTIDPTSRNWAAALAMSATLDATERASTTGTASQWASALANLRDHLQGAGVPPETTDDLVIRHDGDDTWLTDLTDGSRVMLVASPSALEDAQYGLAWAYGLGRPQPIRPYPLSRAERASQRVTAAV